MGNSCFNIPILILLIFSFMPHAGTALAADHGNRNEDVSFRWSFNAIVGPEHKKKLVPITRYNTLKKGDLLKIRLELKKKCFIYFFHRTPEDQLTMLFPYGFDLFDGDYQAGKVYDIPPGQNCFRMDNNASAETFYLVASAGRLRNLERSYLKYDAARRDEKKTLARHILSEIHTIKRQYGLLTASAERPVLIGGNVRALVKDNTAQNRSNNAHKIEVSAPDVYIKTFTIKLQ